MIHSSHKKTGFVFIISILGAFLNQTAFAKNMTCSLEVFSHEKYGSTYNGPCKISIDKNLSRDNEKVFVVERINPNMYLFQKVVGLQITDFPTFSYIKGAFEPNGRDASVVLSDEAKRFTDKNKFCRVDNSAGVKLCIW